MRKAIVVMHGLNTRFPGFLEAARDRGIAVLGTVMNPDHPRARLLLRQRETEQDSPLRAMVEWAPIPPAAVDALVDKVGQWTREYELAGVFSLTDEYVQPAALVAEIFGLQGTGHRAAMLSRNKHLQRRVLPDLSPRYDLILPGEGRERAAAVDVSGAKVCKPLSGNGSIGVRPIEAGGDVPGVVASYPPDQPLLIEDRVAGPEYSVESISLAGRRLVHCVTRKRTTDGAGGAFVELEHTVGPFRDAEEHAALIAAAEETLDKIGMRTGISHCEIRLAQGGSPVLMEVAVRGPGGAIPTLFHLATGVSLEQVLLDALLGEPISRPPSLRRFARQWYLPQEPGMLLDVAVPGSVPRPNWFAETLRRVPVPRLDDDADAAVHEIVVEAGRLSEIEELASDASRACSVLTYAPTLDALDDLGDKLSRELRLVIETGGRNS